MVRRYAAGAAAGAALVVSLTGCLGESGNNAADVKLTAAQAIDLASKKTATVDSYKVDVTADGGGQAAVKAHGVIQVRLRPSLAATGTLDQASFGGLSLPSGEQAILLGDYLYARVPQQLTQFTGGKPWVRFSLSRAGQESGVSVTDLLKKADPVEQTKIFTGSKDVHAVGTETINGVRTTHYRGTITPEEAAARLDPKTRRSFHDLYQRGGAHKVGFDLWVGSDSLPRKLVTTSAESDGKVTATMIFSGFNKSFTVSAPPANQVTDGDHLSVPFGGH